MGHKGGMIAPENHGFPSFYEFQSDLIGTSCRVYFCGNGNKIGVTFVVNQLQAIIIKFGFHIPGSKSL